MFCLVALLLWPVVAPAAWEEDRAVQGSVAADTVWEGRLVVGQMVTVGAGATLTVHPGTQLLFRGGAGLLVEGTLIAEGSKEKPIRFAAEAVEPASDAWAGITLRGTARSSRLRSCVLTNAGALTIAAGSHQIEDCEIRGGVRGIVINGQESRPSIERNRLADLRDGGIECTGGATALIADNTAERCGQFGIAASQGSVPTVLRNTITSCESGIALANTAPALRDNVLRGNKRGMLLTQVNGGRPIQGNQVLENEIGILCQQFSFPEIAGNRIAQNKDGITCFMGARPLIRNNEIARNVTGLVANQISNPTVTANEFRDNGKGIYLNLSSYAVISRNNFEGNTVQIELGNMSADWERRVGKKPRRGRLQQFQRQAERLGAAPGGDGQDGAALGGEVDATENWWGAATTREMEEKGPDADISGLRDWHDVPTLTYEGYEGEYVQDRIRYAPWAKARIQDAGMTLPVAPPAQGACP